MARRNFVVNPKWANNITDGVNNGNYGGGAITITRDTTKFVSGLSTASASFDAANNDVDTGFIIQLSLGPGTYSASAYVATATSGGGVPSNAHFVVRDVTGGNAVKVDNHITTDTSGVFQRTSGFFTISATSTIQILIGLGSYGAVSKGRAWFTNLMIEAKPSLLDYFDGDTVKSGYIYAWTGTANNSVSTETAQPKTATISDDFNDNSINTGLWSLTQSGPHTATETGGRLRVNVATTGAGLAGLTSKERYDLTSSTAYVQVPTVGNQSAEKQEIYFQFGDGSNRVFFLITGGLLGFYQTVNNVQDRVAQVTYSAVNHLYLRFREASGTTYYETSPDGVTYTVQASRANVIEVNNNEVVIAAGAWGGDANAQNVEFDNLNTLGVAAPSTTASFFQMFG